MQDLLVNTFYFEFPMGELKVEMRCSFWWCLRSLIVCFFTSLFFLVLYSKLHDLHHLSIASLVFYSNFDFKFLHLFINSNLSSQYVVLHVWQQLQLCFFSPNYHLLYLNMSWFYPNPVLIFYYWTNELWWFFFFVRRPAW